jgi:hypothetical protein
MHAPASWLSYEARAFLFPAIPSLFPPINSLFYF